MALNLKVLQQDQALRRITKIVRTVRFAVLARYDEDSKHWNYLKIRGPMFLVADTFGSYRLVVLNHNGVENHVILVKADGMRFEGVRLDSGEGFMLNYLIQDSIAGQSLFGIWSADETLLEIEREIQAIIKQK